MNGVFTASELDLLRPHERRHYEELGLCTPTTENFQELELKIKRCLECVQKFKDQIPEHIRGRIEEILT